MFSRVNWTLNTPVDPQTYEFCPNWRSRSTMTAREPWWQLGPSLWLLWKWWKWVPSSRQATEWPWCRIQKTQFLNKFKAEISGKILSFLYKIYFFLFADLFPFKAISARTRRSTQCLNQDQVNIHCQFAEIIKEVRDAWMNL